MNKGPTIRTIPQQKERVCNGCEYLVTQAMLRGHFSCTNNFGCKHPDFNGDRLSLYPTLGKVIDLHHEGNCQTPDWCPFVIKK